MLYISFTLLLSQKVSVLGIDLEFTMVIFRLSLLKMSSSFFQNAIRLWSARGCGAFTGYGSVNFKMFFWNDSFFQNTNEIFLDFCPEFFFSFLGASWKHFGLPGDLVSNVVNKEGSRKPKKLPGSSQKAKKKFRAEIQKYFCWYYGWNWFFIRTFWN